jgi:hypothetical protein
LRVARAAAARRALIARARSMRRDREPPHAVRVRMVAQARSAFVSLWRRSILDR